MSAPEQIFREFVDAYRRDSSTDPREYLSRAEGVDRDELRLLIEAFLERAPRREWDAEAFEGSIAERAMAEGWPELLPALRNRARLKRATVVQRLAAALGFPGSEERVAAYYHLMEQGRLAPGGVSARVLEALGTILGTSAGRLRRSGEAGVPEAGAGGEVFARVGAPSEARAAPALMYADLQAAAHAGPPDELDRLFTGGG
jgi:hypothetical protein